MTIHVKIQRRQPDRFLLRRADGCVWFVRLPFAFDLSVPPAALECAVRTFLQSQPRICAWLQGSRKK